MIISGKRFQADFRWDRRRIINLDWNHRDKIRHRPKLKILKVRYQSFGARTLKGRSCQQDWIWFRIDTSNKLLNCRSKIINNLSSQKPSRKSGRASVQVDSWIQFIIRNLKRMIWKHLHRLKSCKCSSSTITMIIDTTNMNPQNPKKESQLVNYNNLAARWSNS